MLSSSLTNRFAAEHARRSVRPNGLTVVHLEESGRGLASLQLWVRTGSIHEGRWLGAGISHFLEHYLFKGTPTRPGREVARQAQALGGTINAYTTFDRTVYHLDVPAERAAAGLELLVDMVFRPAFPEAEFAREQEVIRREIDMGLDDPDRTLAQAVLARAFREHPYRLPVIGHRALFDGLRLEDLRAYHQTRYVPANAVLVVVGEVDAPLLEQTLAAHLDVLPANPLAPVLVPDEPGQHGLREVRLESDVQVCRGVLAYRIPGLSDADTPALDMLGGILGGGQSSRLWRRLREERRLVHQIGCSAWNPGRDGLFWIGYTADLGRAGEVEAAVREELDAVLHGGLQVAELDKVRRQMLAEEVHSRQTVGGQAARLGQAEVVIGDLGYTRAYFDQLRRQSPETLAAAMRRWLVEERLTCASSEANQATTVRSPARTAGDAWAVRTLSNGLRIALLRDPNLPRVHLRYVAAAGALHEAPTQRGASALVATLLARDTRRHAAAAISERIESAGAALHEASGNNSLGMSLDCFGEDLEDLLPYWADALLEPAFLPATVERERIALLAALREEDDEIVARGRRELRRLFYGAHPFAIEPGGTPESVAALTPEILRAHWQGLRVGRGSVVAAVGDFDPEALGARLEALLGGLPPGDSAGTVVPPSRPAAGPRQSVRMERNQAVVFHAYPCPGIVDPAAVAAAELIEGIVNDMSGELFDRVREQRSLAYFAYSSRVLGVDQGMCVFMGGTHPTTREDLHAEFLREVERLRAGRIAAEELERARNQLKTRRRSSLQSLGGRAGQAALNLLYGLPIESWRVADTQADLQTPESLAAYAGQWLRPSARVELVIGPEA